MRLEAMLGLALAAGGCFESRAVEAERRAAEAKVAADKYEADQLKPVDEAVQALKSDLTEQETASGAAAGKLGTLQAQLAKEWRGDEAQLRTQASAAAVPASLMPFLEAAQKEAGGTAVEQQFKAAVEASSLDGVAAALAGWESSYTPSADGDGHEDGKCEHEQPDITCEKLATDESPAPVRFLCRAKDGGANYVVSAEEGTLFVRRLEPEASGKVRVVRAIGHEWWMIRRDLPEKVEVVSADRGEKVAAKSWVGFVRLTGSTASERLAIAAEAGGKPVAFVPADLDGDGTEEVVEIAPGQVRAVHYGLRSRDVELWSQEETCSRLAARTEAPLQGAKQQCADVLRKVKEAEEAALKLAALQAKAPAPQKTLEAIRDGVAACDLAKVRPHITKRASDFLESEAKESGKTLEVAFTGFCAEASVKEKVAKVSFGKTEVKGSTAVVEAIFKDPKCETGCAAETIRVPLVFVDGAWKVNDDRPKDE
jgi:hypothetical protein